MDFRKVPSCTEVSLWSPEALIDYFRMCNLKDCEKLVKKQGIDGKRFLEMSENDMQKFPKTRVPMLIRMQQEIIKREEKKGFFPLRSETQKGYPTGKLHVLYPPSSHEAHQSENWDGTDSDSFDDDDYEDPDEPEGDADYESPAPGDEDSGSSDGYEPPPTNNDILPINAPKIRSSNPDYIDRPIPSDSVRCPPNPLIRTGVSALTSRGNAFPGIQSSSSQDSPKLPKPTKSPAPSVDRRTKPSIQANAGKLSSTSVSRRLYPPHHSNTFPSRSPKPSIRNTGSGSNTLPTTDISHTAGPVQMPGDLPHSSYKPDNQFSDVSPNSRPPVPNPVIKMPYNSTSGNYGIYSEQWYLGNISRKDAENALRSINKDSTFLVRNCSQSTLSQPYVLMVLYKNKVYNVRIRFDQNNQVYLLGSGGHEKFESVSDIIDYFRKTPLLLIDGKDRGSRQHCKLIYIADKSCN